MHLPQSLGEKQGGISIPKIAKKVSSMPEYPEAPAVPVKRQEIEEMAQRRLKEIRERAAKKKKMEKRIEKLEDLAEKALRQNLIEKTKEGKLKTKKDLSDIKPSEKNLLEKIGFDIPDKTYKAIRNFKQKGWKNLPKKTKDFLESEGLVEVKKKKVPVKPPTERKEPKKPEEEGPLAEFGERVVEGIGWLGKKMPKIRTLEEVQAGAREEWEEGPWGKAQAVGEIALGGLPAMVFRPRSTVEQIGEIGEVEQKREKPIQVTKGVEFKPVEAYTEAGERITEAGTASFAWMSPITGIFTGERPTDVVTAGIEQVRGAERKPASKFLREHPLYGIASIPGEIGGGEILVKGMKKVPGVGKAITKGEEFVTKGAKKVTGEIGEQYYKGLTKAVGGEPIEELAEKPGRTGMFLRKISPRWMRAKLPKEAAEMSQSYFYREGMEQLPEIAPRGAKEIGGDLFTRESFTEAPEFTYRYGGMQMEDVLKFGDEPVWMKTKKAPKKILGYQTPEYGEILEIPFRGKPKRTIISGTKELAEGLPQYRMITVKPTKEGAERVGKVLTGEVRELGGMGISKEALEKGASEIMEEAEKRTLGIVKKAPRTFPEIGKGITKGLSRLGLSIFERAEEREREKEKITPIERAKEKEEQKERAVTDIFPKTKMRTKTVTRAKQKQKQRTKQLIKTKLRSDFPIRLLLREKKKKKREEELAKRDYTPLKRLIPIESFFKETTTRGGSGIFGGTSLTQSLKKGKKTKGKKKKKEKSDIFEGESITEGLI